MWELLDVFPRVEPKCIMILELEFETDLPSSRLKKFVSRDYKGRILKEHGDGRYLVEVEDSEGDFKLHMMYVMQLI